MCAWQRGGAQACPGDTAVERWMGLLVMEKFVRKVTAVWRQGLPHALHDAAAFYKVPKRAPSRVSSGSRRAIPNANQRVWLPGYFSRSIGITAISALLRLPWRPALLEKPT